MGKVHLPKKKKNMKRAEYYYVATLEIKREKYFLRKNNT